MPILPTIQDPADLRGLDEVQLAQLAVEIRETIVRTVAQTGRPPRIVARRRRAHDRAPPPARVAARPDRVGHRPPGLPAQAADRPPRAVRDAAPARRHRRLPAPLRIGARRLRRRPRRDRPVDRRGPRRGARPAPRARAHRGRRRRRGADERPVARGAQRHRPAPDADADRGQRQRDVDQPDGRGVLEVPVRDQAVAAPGSTARAPTTGPSSGSRSSAARSSS